MSAPSSNTRSRSTARPRSKSQERRSEGPSALIISRSVSPKPRNRDVTKTPDEQKTPAALRKEVVDFIDKHPNGDEGHKELKDKIEAYAKAPGVDVNDVLLKLGALSCGANIKKKFKFVLIGDGGTGKSALVKRLMCLGFQTNYEATGGANVNNILFWTNENCSYQVELWDCGGCEKIEGIGQGYFINADACLIMFDVLSAVTHRRVESRYTEFIRVCGPDAPVVVLGNKIDVKVSLHREHFILYVVLWCEPLNNSFHRVDDCQGTQGEAQTSDFPS